MRERLRKVAEYNGTAYNKDDFNKMKSAKEVLRKNIEKKIRTTMIGALSKMESFFGKDWGHGLVEEECSDDQLDKYDLWQQCRDEILNLGNSQIRAATSELDLYDIRQKITFKKV